MRQDGQDDRQVLADAARAAGEVHDQRTAAHSRDGAAKHSERRVAHALGALSVLAVPETHGYVQLAAVLAIVVGLVRVSFGLMRWGWVAYLMSQPVIVGFTSGAAILIIASQVPSALGVTGLEGGILRRAMTVAVHPEVWEPAAVGLSVVTILLVLAGRRFHPVFPGVLAAVVVGLLFSLLTGYAGPTLGAIPLGLPPVTLALPWAAMPALVLPGIVIALVGFAEPSAIARTYAMVDRTPWSLSRPSNAFIDLDAALLAGLPSPFLVVPM